MNLHLGDCLEVLRTLPDNSVDSVVTDPPYGLSFMGKKWDYDVPSVEVWRECLRVLKPGGHALIACGTRTQHRMAVNIEDAGFEVRDVITWLYGSGFPKSLDVSKAIDKAAGAEREVVGLNPNHRGESQMTNEFTKGLGQNGSITAPATEAAKQWSGWGTALKPACEFWTLARKPLIGTVAENVLTHGTGGLNIDGCRVDLNGEKISNSTSQPYASATTWNVSKTPGIERPQPTGRFPANLILDEEAGALLDAQTGNLGNNNRPNHKNHRAEETGLFGLKHHGAAPNDSGGASRFFYCAKASKSERNAGLEGMPLKPGGSNAKGYTADVARGLDRNRPVENFHPTVKPIALMRYLCRLITPPGGIVLDPFMGSGSTGVAAKQEGFRFTGIEREAEYLEIAKRRIENELERLPL